jgi:hypothetical protein
MRIFPWLDALFAACESGQRQTSPSLLLGALQELLTHFPITYQVLDALDKCELQGADENYQGDVYMADPGAARSAPEP